MGLGLESFMAITLAMIKRYCNKITYERGYELYHDNKILSYRDRENSNLGLEYMYAVVEGSHGEEYEVTGIYRSSDDVIYDYSCTCTDYETSEGICKHCVAMFLQYYVKCEGVELGKMPLASGMVSERNQIEHRTMPIAKQLIHEYSMRGRIGYIQPAITGVVEIEPTLVREYQKLHLEFKIGIDQKYVIKNLDQFVVALEDHMDVAYGKKLSFIHDESAFTSQGQELAYFIKQSVKEDQNKARHSYELKYSKEYMHMKELKLVPRMLERFLSIMRDKPFTYQSGYGRGMTVEVLSRNPDIRVEISPLGTDGARVRIPFGEVLWGETRMYVLHHGVIYECSKTFTKDMKELLVVGEKEEEVYLDLYGEDIRAFCATILPILNKHCIVAVNGMDIERYIPVEAVCKVYLEMTDKKEIIARLRVKYGEEIYDMLDGFRQGGIYRNVEKESAVLEMVAKYFSLDGTKPDQMILSDQISGLFELLHEGIAAMNQVAEVYVDEKIKRLKVHKSPKFNIGVALKQRLLEVKLLTEELPMKEIHQFLASYRQKKRYHRMKNGDFMELNDPSIGVLVDLVDGLHLDDKQLKNGVLSLPKYRALYLEQILDEHSDHVEIAKNQAYKSLIQEMRTVEESNIQVPVSLEGILRNYQKTGYRWLRTLEQFGFGGILADDMGLGKTLQVIALLLAAKEEGNIKLPSIIVCPASLVYNWEGELNKFAPSLRVAMVAGTIGERQERIEFAEQYDVLVTSYDLLKRDLEFYEKKEFHYQILDEAQAIKNYTTIAARSVKQIDAQTRFALTGTPIENRLHELWSLFDYLMPGMLFTYTQFKKELEVPIVLKKDKVSTRRLQMMIKPFILRRLKQDVLTELPEKEENVVYTKLEGEQLALYSSHVQLLKKRLRGQSKEEFQNSKLQTLAELMRLRQLCCEPSLVYEQYRGESAKMETCMELIHNAVESGHKVLLFSQFTSLLAVLETRLQKDNIGYYKLTGSTKKEERMNMVNQFQGDDVPVFLISLKAGGTGLNLTAANIVIHFDPWWNLAAENQATDRAYRIGQTENVSVYKIIAKDSVEENILKLQERKKGLADQIISEGGVSISELSRDDLMGLIEEM